MFKLDLTQNLHFDLRIWIDYSLIRSHNIIAWLGCLHLKEDVLILTLVDDLNRAEALAIFLVFFENQDLRRFDRDVLCPIL
jgi:hypothetical protein